MLKNSALKVWIKRRLLVENHLGMKFEDKVSKFFLGEFLYIEFPETLGYGLVVLFFWQVIKDVLVGLGR